jgi:hypothetical protein
MAIINGGQAEDRYAALKDLDSLMKGNLIVIRLIFLTQEKIANKEMKIIGKSLF